MTAAGEHELPVSLLIECDEEPAGWSRAPQGSGKVQGHCKSMMLQLESVRQRRHFGSSS